MIVAPHVTLAKLLDFGRQLNNAISYTSKPQGVTQQAESKNCSRESYTSKPLDVTHPEGDPDSDLDEKDDLLDDPREPSHAEVERSQARKIQELLTDNRMLTRELEAERNQLNQLRQAHSELVSQKGSWTLEVAEQSHLQGEVEQLRSQLAAAQDELLSYQRLNEQIAQEKDELGAQLAERDQELERSRSSLVRLTQLMAKCDHLEKGYQKNSFTQGLKDLREIARAFQQRT